MTYRELRGVAAEHPLWAILLAATLCALAAILWASMQGAVVRAAQADTSTGAPAGVEEPEARAGAAELAGARTAVARRGMHVVARVREGGEVELLDAPAGDRIARLGDETEFGSPRTFYVARIEGWWLGVPAPEAGNGALGWIEYSPDALEFGETPYSVRASLSEGIVEVRRAGRVAHRFPVTVGRPGSETPTGRFAVTDTFAGDDLPHYYGCCVLALSGRQPNPPPGWQGGDRLAIHGSPDAIGGARSAGCLRATDDDMTHLLETIPLGAPVLISE